MIRWHGGGGSDVELTLKLFKFISPKRDYFHILLCFGTKGPKTVCCFMGEKDNGGEDGVLLMS